VFGFCFPLATAHRHSQSHSESLNLNPIPNPNPSPFPGFLALLDAGESRKIQFASSRARSQQLNQQIALEIVGLSLNRNRIGASP